MAAGKDREAVGLGKTSIGLPASTKITSTVAEHQPRAAWVHIARNTAAPDRSNGSREISSTSCVPSTSPWISFGGGFGHFGDSSSLEFGGAYTGKTGTTVGVIQAGVGLDVKIIGNLKLRGEARDFLLGVPQLNVITNKNWQHNIFVGGGVTWRF